MFVFVKPRKRTHAEERVVPEHIVFDLNIVICVSLSFFKLKAGIKGKGLIHAVDSNARFDVFSQLVSQTKLFYLVG